MSQFKKIPNKGLKLKPKPLHVHIIYKIKTHLPSFYLRCQIPLVKLFFRTRVVMKFFSLSKTV